jgi:secreted PhoX family phosphatase
MKKHIIALTIGLVVLQQAAHASNNTTFDQFTAQASSVAAGSLPETAPLALPNASWTQQAVVINNSPTNYGDNWDMIDTNRTGVDAGRYLFAPYETGAAGVMRVDTWTNTAQTIVAPGTQGFVSGDASRWTPWGTYLTAEESWGTGSTKGRLFEITNPLADPGSINFVNRSTTVLPHISHEGLVFDAQNNFYFIDETNGGNIYKYTSVNANATNGDDFFSAGQTSVLKVGAGSNSRATGSFTWEALTDVSGLLLPATASSDLAGDSFDGRKAANLVAATDYNRPEDMEIQHTDNGDIIYVATTTDHEVYSINLMSNSVSLFADRNTTNLLSLTSVGTQFTSPDNMAIDADGNMYIIEDQPGGQADIWFAKDLNKDGDLGDAGEGLERWLSMATVGAEPTGLYFDIFNPNVAYVNIQHADSDKDTLMKITAPAAVPVPAAAWLMGSGLVGLTGIARRRRMHD